jgi:hypothetical protein
MIAPVAICKACGIVHTETAPLCDCPETLFSELIEELRHAMDNTERTLQAWIGPSEIGDPCDRALIRKLTLTPEPARSASRPDGWRARVGSAIHTQNEGVFASPALLGRYVTEGEIDVGDIDGRPVTGHCDLFDTAAGAVWDWKTKSKTTLEEAKRDIRMGRGPGQLYRVQQHLYGRGMARLGHRVTRVGLVFLPRDGNLRDAGYWSEPYDEGVAVRALQRCTGLVQLVGMLGKDAALSMFPLCEGEYCDWCLAERIPPPPVPFKAGPLPTSRDLLASVKGALA